MKHILEMKKVYFPCYGKCEFWSLKEALNFVHEMRGEFSVYIAKIVMYNIRFRDCLRKEGIDGVIKMLISEASEVALESDALDYLRKIWKDRMEEHIASYDIQCLPKDGWIMIEDCLFDGLDDINSQTEIYGNLRSLHRSWYTHDGYKRNPVELHIGNVWESYPMFDSSDASDDRSYNNYVFSKVPLTEEMMEQYCNQVSARIDSCMVHEHIPEALLPILYYNGDSDYVLLATAKK